MYVRRVKLENIKGFSDLDFLFEASPGSHAGWYVITGDNGAGKTVLLKAIAMSLVGPDTIRSLQPSFDGWVRAGVGSGEIAVQIVAEEFDRFTTGRPYTYPFWSEYELHLGNGREPVLAPSSKRRGGKKGPLNGPWAANTAGWFSAGYGPFRRLYGASPAAQRLMSGPERVARFATLFKEDATLEECEYWLKDLNYKRLEGKAEAEQLLTDTISILNDDFLQNGMQVIRVDSESLWLRDEAGNELRLGDMSEGYRAALAMMADILRQMSIVYPGQRLIEVQEDAIVVPHHGVVLIDEVDAHLHPEWQRAIGTWLTKRFPNVQFIVTTHSPLVAQAAEQGAIYHLPAPGSGEAPFQLSDEDTQRIRASKADVVLVSPAFGLPNTRSPEAVAKRKAYAQLRSKQNSVGLSDLEREELDQLELFMQHDPEFGAE